MNETNTAIERVTSDYPQNRVLPVRALLFIHGRSLIMKNISCAAGVITHVFYICRTKNSINIIC